MCLNNKELFKSFCDIIINQYTNNGVILMKKHYLYLTLAIFFIGCGSSNNSTQTIINDGTGDIDLVSYFPTESTTRLYSTVDRYGSNDTDVDTTYSSEEVLVETNKITTKEDNTITEIVTYDDTNITTLMVSDKNETQTIYRHVDIGDTISTFQSDFNTSNDLGMIQGTYNLQCTVESKESSFSKNDHAYSGDLLKVKCINQGDLTYTIKPDLLMYITDLNGTHEHYDVSYLYLKEDVGVVASINDNCIPNEKILSVIDDRQTDCNQTLYTYDFY